MSSAPRGPNDPNGPDTTQSDAGSGGVARVDKTEFLLDGTDEAPAIADSETQIPESNTPPDPLNLTVDFQPKRRATTPGMEPLLTITDATDVGIGSAPGVPIAPAATVRHSVPGYEILQEIGRGGMGVVYLARQKGLNRLVALKMILSAEHAGPAQRQRFRREAEAVAALQHPNIVQIFEINEADGRPYLAFEFIDGGSLAQQLGGTPWAARDAASLIEILARAVQFAHDRGIVHRDLKPGNIMLAAERHAVEGGGSNAERLPANPKITDFGLAKRVESASDWSTTGELGVPVPGTRTGAVMGTPSYIAPEQAAGKNRDVGPAADVYALGAILYELLTGRPPFRGETALDTVLQVMSDEPVPPRRLQPKILKDLETICLRCLQKSPAKRYASAGDLAEDLRRFVAHEPIAARPVGSVERFVKWAKRHPAAATSLFTSIFALLTLLAISFYFNIELRQLAEDKENEARKAREAQVDAEKSAKEKEDQTRIANEERKKANDRLKDVEEARKKADAAREASLRREEEARRAAYALALNRAAALTDRDPLRAARLLDANAPAYLRDFTWLHLRAVCRIEQLVGAHEKPVNRVAFSPDGAYLASASWDETVRVWDARTHRAVAILGGHRGYVRSVEFLGDGRTLVTAGNDHSIRFWELPPGLPEAAGAPPTLRPWATVETGDVVCLAVSPTGAAVAAGGSDGKIALWSVAALPRQGLMGIGGGPLAFITRAPEGPRTANLGPALAVPWKPVAQAPLAGHPSTVAALVWARSGLYSGGFDKTVRLWKPGESVAGEIVLTHSESILALDVSSTAERLALTSGTGDDVAIRLFDLRQRKDAGRLRGHTRTVEAVDFSQDGRRLASASRDGTIRLWDLVSGQEQSILRSERSKEPIRSVAFSPDGRTLASGGNDNAVRMWGLADRHEMPVNIAAGIPLTTAALSGDGTLLVLADKDGGLKVWRRLAAGFPTAPTHVLKGSGGRVAAVAVGPRGESLAVAFDQNEEWAVTVWEFSGGAAEPRARTFKAPAAVHSLALHGRRLALAGEAGLIVWDLEARKVLHQLATVRGKPRCVVFTPDGRQLVSVGGVHMQVWDATSGVELAYRMTGHGAAEIYRVAVGEIDIRRQEEDDVPRALRIVTCDETGTARLWGLEPAQTRPDGRPPTHALRLAEGPFMTGHSAPLTWIAFAPDGRTIVTASEDHSLRFWDPVGGQERASLAGHDDAVLLAAFLPGGNALLSAGREGTLKLRQAPQ